MAITSNSYTGNGSTTLYSFTFPYLDESHVKVTLNGTLTTAYTFANATTIQFNTAPSAGVAIRIYRETDDSALEAVFSPGSSIRAADLNVDFDQLLYLGQESNNIAEDATTTANTALTNSNTAISTANAATSTANTALSTANAAVVTANTAESNSLSAVSTANTANSNASAAVSTANSASAAAASAVSTANTASSNASTALSTANTALSNSTAAVSTANTASSNASAAVSTANTASSNASTALSTANSALSTANTALSNSATAISTANAASAAVASAVIYQPVVDLAALALLTPADGDFFELQDSTGADTDPSITGVTAGLVGSPGLTFRLRYDDPPQEYVFLGYFANDSETRYLKLAGGTLTGQLLGDNSTSAATPGFAFDSDPNTGIGRPGADELALITGGTARLTIDSAGAISIPGTQTVTGTSTAASFIPSSSTVPTNGVYLPAANSVGISTNGSGRLFVSSAGNIGLGTASPLATANYTTLTIDGTNGAQIAFRESGVGNKFIYSTTTDLEYRNNNTGNQIWYTSGNERMRLDSSGRLGIGASSPSSLLHVEGTAGNAKIRLGTGGDHTLIGPDSSGHTIINAGTAGGNMQLQLAGSTKVTLNSTGLGIGTSPSTPLHISADGTELRVQTTNNSNFPSLQFRSSGGGTYGGLSFDPNGASALIFTNGNHTERARIDGSGRLLVGTATGVSGSTAQLLGSSGSSTGAAVLFLQRGQAASSIVSNENIGRISFADNVGNTYAMIDGLSDAAGGTNDYPGRLVFSTTADGASSPTERMRINSAGSVFTFTNSTGYVGVSNAGNNAAEAGFAFFKSGTGIVSGTLCMQIKQDGDLENTNNSYGAISDLKLKENIVDAGSQWDDLKSLQVRKFNFKAETNYGTHTQIGLIAQEVELVSPGLVSESPDRDAEGNDLGTVTKSVNYSVLYMKAVKALQEAMERIETLEAKVAALEGA